MDQYRTNLIIRVAKLHYELGLSQIEISQQEHLSTSTVSRLIKLASQMGYVKISVVEPKHSFTDLEDRFMARFHLKKVTILSDIVENRDILVQDVCQSAAEDIAKMVQDNYTIGISWGRTLTALSQVLVPIKKKNVSVVQLNGGVSRVLYDSGYTTAIRSFVENYNAEGYMLPAPALVSNTEIASSIKSDHFIHEALDLAQRCDIAIYSVGTMSQDSVFYQMGYFSKEQYDNLSKQAVGDCCSHFMNETGEIADPLLDSRVIAVPLSTIKDIPHKVVIAIGQEKAKSILAAIRGGLVDYLYIDQPTARDILQLSNKLDF